MTNAERNMVAATLGSKLRNGMTTFRADTDLNEIPVSLTRSEWNLAMALLKDWRGPLDDRKERGDGT